MSRGTSLRHPFIEVRDRNGQFVPLAMFFDAGALRPPALLKLRLPCFNGLFGNNRVIQSAVCTLDPSVQRPLLDLLPLLHGTAKAGELGELKIVIRDGSGRYLVPGRAPQQNGSAEAFSVSADRKFRVAQPANIQRHKGEVGQIDARINQWRGKLLFIHTSPHPAPAKHPEPIERQTPRRRTWQLFQEMPAAPAQHGRTGA